MILEMLEDGKITANEATQLLESLKHAGVKRERWEEEDDWDFGEHVKVFSKNVEAFSREVGAKMDSAFKTMEPKLRAATKVVVEKDGQRRQRDFQSAQRERQEHGKSR